MIVQIFFLFFCILIDFNRWRSGLTSGAHGGNDVWLAYFFLLVISIRLLHLIHKYLPEVNRKFPHQSTNSKFYKIHPLVNNRSA